MRDDVPGYSFLRGWISRMECCGASEKEKTDTTTRYTEVYGRLNKWCTKSRDGMPGLKIKFGSTNRNIKWIPVTPSPTLPGRFCLSQNTERIQCKQSKFIVGEISLREARRCHGQVWVWLHHALTVGDYI